MEKGKVVVHLTLASQHMNSSGSLHGACSAAIVDMTGGLAVASVTGKEKTGVSVDIHVTYQSGAVVGDLVEITARCERAGRNLAFTTIEIRKMKKGEQKVLVASGSHTKSVTHT